MVMLSKLEAEFQLRRRLPYLGLKGFVEPCPKVAIGEEIHSEQSDQIGQRPAEARAELEVADDEDGNQSPVQTWIFRALAEVPTKVLMRRFCLMALKKSSICQRSL